ARQGCAESLRSTRAGGGPRRRSCRRARAGHRSGTRSTRHRCGAGGVAATRRIWPEARRLLTQKGPPVRAALSEAQQSWSLLVLGGVRWRVRAGVAGVLDCVAGGVQLVLGGCRRVLGGVDVVARGVLDRG